LSNRGEDRYRQYRTAIVERMAAYLHTQWLNRFCREAGREALYCLRCLYRLCVCRVRGFTGGDEGCEVHHHNDHMWGFHVFWRA